MPTRSRTAARPTVTDADKALAARILARSFAPSSFEAYVYAAFPGHYDLAPHHRLIIEHLEAVERGEIKRLMIMMPPRRGKSALASELFPAWFLGRNPDKSVIACSHTATLAYRFSRRVRRQLSDDHWPFPGVALRRGEATVQRWGIEGRTGGYQAAGVGGPITGDGADLLLIDDPVKSREHAHSPTRRDAIGEWYDSDAYTRLSPSGAVVLIQTRWHGDDLAGRQLAAMGQGGDDWTVLCLPELAIEGEVDPLGREPGDALWPDRFPADKTAMLRATRPHVWWPLFQQRPQAVTGGMLRREYFSHRYDPAVLPEFVLVGQFVDSAFSTEVAADPSAIATWAATDSHLYVLDYWCDRVEYPELIAAVKDQHAKWAHLGPWVYIENKASGQSAIQTLRRETGIPVRKFEPGTASKLSRVQDASPYFAADRVLLPSGPRWVAEWIDEHVNFPGAAHDEAPDTSAMATRILGRLMAGGAELSNEGDSDA